MNSEVTKKNRILQIDALRGFAIFCVILGHAIILFPINLHEVLWCRYLFMFVSSFHRQLLFLVSGLCFSQAVNSSNYLAFIVRKLKRLVVPYIIFNVLDAAARMLAPSLVNRPKSFKESFVGMALYGGEYWFLYALFLIFLIYPFIFAAFKRVLRRLSREGNIIYWGIIIIYVAVFFIPVVLDVRTEIFCMGMILRYLPYFNLGVLVRFVRGNAYNPGKVNLFVRLFAESGRHTLELYLLNGFTLALSRYLIVNLCGVSNPAVIIGFNMFVDFYLTMLVVKYFKHYCRALVKKYKN